MKSIHGFTMREIYDQAYLEKLGVTFETFVAAPVTVLEAVGQRDAVEIMQAGHRPLMPVQVQLRRTLEKEWAQQGVAVEKRLHRKVSDNRSYGNTMVLAV